MKSLKSYCYNSNSDVLQISQKQPLFNKKIKIHTESPEGRAMFCVVREFLDFFNLDFTISVFEPESYLGTSYKYEGRCKTIEGLGISELDRNTSSPILLQLIHLAKQRSSASNNTVNIHLHNIQQEPVNGTESDLEIKSDTTKSQSSKEGRKSQNHDTISENLGSTQNSNAHNKEVMLHQNALNETFNLSSPSVAISPRTNIANDGTKDLTTLKQAINGHEDLVEDKSSTSHNDETSSVPSETSLTEEIKEPSLIDLDKSIKLADSKSGRFESEKQKYIIDQSLHELEYSPPVLKESKSHMKLDTSVEKLKLSPQITEKLKPKNTLSSLADLPPLQMTKTRPNDSMILPSLYNREFKERASLKEMEKGLDTELDSLDNYEEDFMSGSDLELSTNKTDLFQSDSVRVNLLEDFHRRSDDEDKTKKKFVTSKLESTEKDYKASDSKKGEDKSDAASNEESSISASLELESNSEII